MAADLTVRPLTPDLWPALEGLFGRGGASNGCWCMYWRIGAAYAKRPRSENRADFQGIVERGPPPGLVAFAGDLAVGWCQATPRAALPHLEARRLAAGPDGAAAWSISCFYVRRGWRRRGVTAALARAALERASAAGAASIEAYPVDTSDPKATRNAYTGVASTFRRLGFSEVARTRYGRVVMRRELG
jgi:GNAT superfamily N-acetyltransferase